MTRVGLARTLGVLTFLTSVLLVLSGSDLPPPSGFLWAVLIAAVVGVAVLVLIPAALRLQDRAGIRRAGLTAAAVGLAFGVGAALLLVLGGSGEPSDTKPGPLDAVIFLTIVGMLGAFTAAAIVGLAIMADRAKTRNIALLVIVVPACLVILPITAVIIARLTP